MNPTGIMLILSGLVGLILSVFGAYTVVDNLMHPQGLLFEGIVLGGLGIIMLLLVTIASAIGKTMLTFVDIMRKQAELQNQLRQPQAGGGMASLLSKMLSNPNNITIETTGTMPDNLKNLMKQWYPDPEYADMTIEQLEERLAQAMKKEDYEEAEEINKVLRKKKGLDNPDSQEGGKKDE